MLRHVHKAERNPWQKKPEKIPLNFYATMQTVGNSDALIE